MKDAEIYGKDPSGTFRVIRTDTEGRMIRGYYVRDITTTGSSTLLRNDENIILTGVAGTYLDLVTITASNTSGVAINLNIRSGKGASVAHTLTVPATNSITQQFDPPYPATEKAAVWTAATNQTGEISDSPVSVTMIAVNHT